MCSGLGKTRDCLRYVSRKSLELIIVHKKCLENFRVSFRYFWNEKRKAEKWGKYSGMLRRGYCSPEQIFLLLSTTLDDHNFFVRSPISVFLDSMEIHLSLESIHIYLDTILSL